MFISAGGESLVNFSITWL